MKTKSIQEFLVTYGWAILVVLIAMGVLAYFGVFSLDKSSPLEIQDDDVWYDNAAQLCADTYSGMLFDSSTGCQGNWEFKRNFLEYNEDNNIIRYYLCCAVR